MAAPKAIIIRVWDAIKRHPIYTTLGGVGFLGAFDGFERARAGADMMANWFGPDWLAVTIASPYFNIVCLGVAVACFFWIGHCARQEELDLSKSEWSIQTRLISEFVAVQKACQFELLLASLTTTLNSYENSVAQLRQSDTQEMPADILDGLNSQAEALRHSSIRLHSMLDKMPFTSELTVHTPARVTTPISTRYAPRCQFNPADNAEYFRQHENNVANLRNHFRTIETHLGWFRNSVNQEVREVKEIIDV